MSKLYDLYKLSKIKNPDKFILIKSGTFYLFLDDDALKVSDKLGLKLTYLNESVLKCGFPLLSLPKYEKMLKANSIDYLITGLNLNNSNQNEIEKRVIEDLRLLDINNLSPIAAINLLKDFQEKLNSSLF